MTYTLTEKEVSNLHNARVYLLYALEHCNEMFKEDAHFIQNMKRSMSYLEPVSTRLTKELDEERDEVFGRARKIARNNNFNHTVWSMYEVKNFEDKSNVPEGAKLRSYYTSKDFTVTVEGPTWLDLWKATERLICMTRNIHGDHIFIEGYYKVKDDDNVYEVSLGS